MTEGNVEYVRSLADDKCDPKLGAEVQKHLAELGLVQLAKTDKAHAHYNPRVAVQQFAAGIQSGMACLGLDIEDPSLVETPMRYAKMVVGELTKGLNFDFFPKITTFPNGQKVFADAAGVLDRLGEPINPKDESLSYIRGKYDQMVLLRKISTLSLCEHHLQTIDGWTHIAYIPNERMIGLSKLARVTEFFARRPQVQERMTEQIYAALRFVLGTEDIAVVQDCVHYCMRARGSLQHSSSMTTDKLGGRFLTNGDLRKEFFDRVSSN